MLKTIQELFLNKIGYPALTKVFFISLKLKGFNFSIKFLF